MSFRPASRLHRLYIQLALSACVMPVLGACDSTGPSQEPDASFEATWANQRWRGDASASRIEGDSVVNIVGTQPVNAGSLPQTYVSISVVPDGPGIYTLRPGDAEFRYLVGGDVVTATYAISQGQTGTLIIYTITDTQVNGTVSFNASTASSDPPVGATASFDGTFRATLTTVPGGS